MEDNSALSDPNPGPALPLSPQWGAESRSPRTSASGNTGHPAEPAWFRPRPSVFAVDLAKPLLTLSVFAGLLSLSCALLMVSRDS